MSKKKRKICIVINSRANYGRVKSLLFNIKKNKHLELQIVLGASALIYRFGAIESILKKDGFKVSKKYYSIVDGENLVAMTKSLGLTVIELTNIFSDLKPDIVLVIADRYENLAVGVVASYMNIFLAHVQGGEVSGSIDEKVRHALTKLSDIHFPATDRARNFLIKMGEDKKRVFKTGCPSLDICNRKLFNLEKNFFFNYGSGYKIKNNDKYIIVLQHPVTTEYLHAKRQITETIKAVQKFNKIHNVKILWLWPNIDAGSDVFSKELRLFKDKGGSKFVQFVRNFNPEDYIRVLKKSLFIVGNSSSGLRECSFLGLNCINIGTRQANRESAENVVDCDYNSNKIFKIMERFLKKNIKIKKSYLYGSGNAGQKIAKILSSCNISIKQKLSYIK